VAAIAFALVAAASVPLDPMDRQAAELCRERRRPEAGWLAHPDLYCMTLLPGARTPDASGEVELRHEPGPFTVAMAADGGVRRRLVVTVRDLPAPESLGPYAAYVAWAATPTLTEVHRLGAIRRAGATDVGTVSLDKFIVLVSAEPETPGTEPIGPFVLRAQSPSTRMLPADFLQFTLGAAPAEAAGHEGHGADTPDDPWAGVPMPPDIMMLPGMMLLRPNVDPWSPGDGWEGEIVDARPRALIRVAPGDTLALEAVYVRRRIGDRTLLGYGFNGQIPGPLLWVEQGTTITVDFTNRIDWPTSIHWHGLRLDNRFDGVPGVTQEPVAPGETFRYRVRFPDAGLYWYHPHHREDIQQDLGLAGNLMVRSPDPSYYGPAHREEVLMLDDLLLGEHGLVPFGLERATHTLMGRFGNTLLVNGEPDWTLDVDRGEVVRFFLTNVSNTRTFNLSFGGAPMKVVGTDVGNFEREETVESVLIAPAERYIIHVRFPQSGVVPLLNRVHGIDHVAGRFHPEEDTLGVVRVGTRAATPDLSAEFERLRVHDRVRDDIARYRDRFDDPPDRELELDMRRGELPLLVNRLMRLDSVYFHPVEASRTMPMMNLMSTSEEVSWALRDPATGAENEEIRWRFRVGDVVRIRLRSLRETLHQMQHPIHIHGQRFLVTAVNGVPNDNLAWKDTVLVPAGGTVDLLLEVTNPGRWMLHCHVAEHLEAGMRMVFEVEE